MGLPLPPQPMMAIRSTGTTLTGEVSAVRTLAYGIAQATFREGWDLASATVSAGPGQNG
jgi:hypothetical protein